MVPSVYLLKQLHRWLQVLSDPTAPVKVHCLEPSNPVLPQTLPCILLTTPSALFALEAPPPLQAVHHIILDEPDTQINPVPPRFYPTHLLPSHPVNKHPPPATRILDHLLGISRGADMVADFQGRLGDVQTVWCSASLNAPFRAFVKSRGWVRRAKTDVVNLDFTGSSGSDATEAQVEHYCVVVDPVTGVLANLTEQASLPSIPMPAVASTKVKGLSFPPVLAEALAMLHVQAPLPPGKTALVLAPDETSLAKLGDELSSLGLSTQVLDPTSSTQPATDEIPDLYLLPRSQSPGLHLENLHTVYLLSGLDSTSLSPAQKNMGGTMARIRAYDSYQGRVGRLGTEHEDGDAPQRVVSIIAAGGDEERLMQRVFFAEGVENTGVKLREWPWGGLDVDA
jgi:hypothetical protein